MSIDVRRMPALRCSRIASLQHIAASFEARAVGAVVRRELFLLLRFGLLYRLLLLLRCLLLLLGCLLLLLLLIAP